MVQKVKDRLISSLLMIATGITISVFSVGYTNRKSDSKILDEKINGKLDKTEYIQDQNNREEKHQKIHDRDREDLLYIRGKVDETYKFLLDRETK